MDRTRREFLLTGMRASIASLTVITRLPGLASLSGAACARPRSSGDSRQATPEATRGETRDSPVARLERSKQEWRELLRRDSYDVLFEEDTERPFSSPLNDEKRTGTFVCAACYLPLFESSAKFDSGTGWPSFYQPITGHAGKKKDYKLLYPRTEYHCARCGGHQGHIFSDGPPPTGERWCNNGLALRFVPRDEPLPELRP